ncbi:MAG: glycosyltransferase family 4 protein [Saprospiraceae bacterium]|jgi:glycosyltransferase involved in cell wall biosynthesis|nr:glycosyltransferase family 4 protein [Saprospiraceae bacterium]
MRIILISQFFYPEPCAPRGLEFAKELVKEGHEVVCITGFPNYPDGKIYKGYKQSICEKEKIDGIDVMRFPLYINHTKSVVKRFLSYGSFALTLLFIVPLFVRGRFDIMFSYCPPLTVPFATICLNWFYRSKLVIDIQDFWPDTLTSAGGLSQKSLLYKMIHQVSYFTYKRADHISVISPGFKDKLVKEDFDSNKITVIYNWSTAREQEALTEEQIKQLKVDLGFNNNFIILFAGNIGQAQALDHTIEVMKDIQESHPMIQMYFYGSGVEKNRLGKICKEQNVKNIHYRDRVTLEEINKIQQAADVLFLNLKNDPLFEITIPSKLSGYFMLGKPVIGGLKGNAKQLLKESTAGFEYSSESAKELKSKLIAMYNLSARERNKMGKNGNLFYHEKMSKKVGVGRFLSIFQKLQNS